MRGRTDSVAPFVHSAFERTEIGVPARPTRGRTESVAPFAHSAFERTEIGVPARPTRGRTDSVAPFAHSVFEHTQVGMPPRTPRRGRTNGVPPRPPSPPSRIVTIPPLRSEGAPSMGVPIVVPSTLSESTGVPIAIPSSSVVGDAETTRRLAPAHSVLASLERGPSIQPPLPPLDVRPLATPAPGNKQVTPPRSSPRLQTTESGESDEPTGPIAVRVARPRPAWGWPLRGLVFACMAYAVGTTAEESSEPVSPSSVPRSSSAPAASEVRAAPDDAPDDVPATLDPVAATAALPDPGGDVRYSHTDVIAAEDSETDTVSVSLRLDEKPKRTRSRRTRSRRARVGAPPAIPETPAFDAWKYMPPR
jgi:hypothetical protein